jgi:hypothetical protein
MNYDYFRTDGEHREDWERMCNSGEYVVVPPSHLPGPLPDALTKKFDSVVVAASGVPGTDHVFYMLNGHRVDAPAGEIDQQPFGLYFHGDQASVSGCLIQHGNWEGRTTEPPPDFWDHLDASGLGHCYPLSELPSDTSGDLADLPKSQSDAFAALVEVMKRGLYPPTPTASE